MGSEFKHSRPGALWSHQEGAQRYDLRFSRAWLFSAPSLGVQLHLLAEVIISAGAVDCLHPPEKGWRGSQDAGVSGSSLHQLHVSCLICLWPGLYRLGKTEGCVGGEGMSPPIQLLGAFIPTPTWLSSARFWGGAPAPLSGTSGQCSANKPSKFKGSPE